MTCPYPQKIKVKTIMTCVHVKVCIIFYLDVGHADFLFNSNGYLTNNTYGW